MPSLTDAKKKMMYAALAALLFILLVFALVATAATEWSRNRRASPQTSAGLWGGCVDSPDTRGWIGATCRGVYNSGVCNGWFQAARIFSCLAVAFALVAFCVALACALTGGNKALGALLVCLIFIMAMMAMMAFISWILFRKPSCSNTDGQDLGSSFGLMCTVFGAGLLALCLAAFLMIAKKKGEEEIIIEEYVDKPYYPGVESYAYPAAYPAAYPYVSSPVPAVYY